MKSTHYEILGVEIDADEATIRAAYRKLVLEVHPDRSDAPDAKDRFIRVNQAYEVLLDPVRRASYNRVLLMEAEEAARAPAPAPKPDPPSTKLPRDPTKGELIRLMQLVNKGLLVEAEKVAQNLTVASPREPLPYAVLGDIARVRGRLRDASNYYAYAIQMEPSNRTFAQKHAEVSRILMRQEPIGTIHRQHAGPAALITGAFATVACAVYVATTRETPLLPDFALISTWTLGLFMGLIVSGIAMGAALAVANQVEPLALRPNQGDGSMSMAISLGLVAIIQFWVACFVFVLVGAFRKAFNPSMCKLLGAVAGITVIYTIAAVWQPGSLSPIQVLVWGGNLTYFGAVLGWQVAESFR